MFLNHEAVECQFLSEIKDDGGLEDIVVRCPVCGRLSVKDFGSGEGTGFLTDIVSLGLCILCKIVPEYGLHHFPELGSPDTVDRMNETVLADREIQEESSVAAD